MTSLADSIVCYGEREQDGPCTTGRAPQSGASVHPVARHHHFAPNVQQLAWRPSVSFKRPSLPATHSRPLTKTMVDMFARHIALRQFVATADTPTGEDLQGRPPAGVPIDNPNFEYGGDGQSEAFLALPLCNSNSASSQNRCNSATELAQDGRAPSSPTFPSRHPTDYRPYGSSGNLLMVGTGDHRVSWQPFERAEMVCSPLNMGSGRAANMPFHSAQCCQQMQAPSSPAGNLTPADQLPPMYAPAIPAPDATSPPQNAAACAPSPQQHRTASTGVHQTSYAPAALTGSLTVTSPGAPGGGVDLLGCLRQALLPPAAAPGGASWPQQSDEQHLQVAEMLAATRIHPPGDFNGGSVLSSQGPRGPYFNSGSVLSSQGPRGPYLQLELASAQAACAVSGTVNVNPGNHINSQSTRNARNTSRSNNFIKRNDGSCFSAMDLRASASHRQVDGSSKTPASAALHLPPPVMVQVASRSRRAGDASSGRGRLTRGAVGLFHPELYLKGGDCIECGAEMMSRGRFERLAGTATAKWHVSIKVLPSGMTLGRWLHKHGLPILQGRPRKRRAGTQEEDGVEDDDENTGPVQGAMDPEVDPAVSQSPWDLKYTAVDAAAARPSSADLPSSINATSNAAAAAAWKQQQADERAAGDETRSTSDVGDDPLAMLLECPGIVDAVPPLDPSAAPAQDTRGAGPPANPPGGCLLPGRTLIHGARPLVADTAAPGLRSSGYGQDSSSRLNAPAEALSGSKWMGVAWPGASFDTAVAGAGSVAAPTSPLASAPGAIPAGGPNSAEDLSTSRQSGASFSGSQALISSGGSFPVACNSLAAVPPPEEGARPDGWAVNLQPGAPAAPRHAASAEARPSIVHDTNTLQTLGAYQTDSRLSTSGASLIIYPASGGSANSLGSAPGGGGVATLPATCPHQAPQTSSGTDWPCFSSSDMSPDHSRQDSVSRPELPWGLAGLSSAQENLAMAGGGSVISSAPTPVPYAPCPMAPGPAVPQAGDGSCLGAMATVAVGSSGGHQVFGRQILAPLFDPSGSVRRSPRYFVSPGPSQHQHQQLMVSRQDYALYPQRQLRAAYSQPGEWQAGQPPQPRDDCIGISFAPEHPARHQQQHPDGQHQHQQQHYLFPEVVPAVHQPWAN